MDFFKEWSKLRTGDVMYQMSGAAPASDIWIQGYTLKQGYISTQDYYPNITTGSS